MKKLCMMLLICMSSSVFAAGPPGFDDDIPLPTPQGAPGVPIDGGISLFLMGAAGAGAWLLKKSKS